MKNVSGIRLTLPDFQGKDFIYEMYPVYEKDWFSLNIALDASDFIATAGIEVKPPVCFHIGIAKKWQYLLDFKLYFDLLIGFEFCF
ncbi:MAG: hypothetical protein AB7T02_02465 [Mesotoga sp.]|uniref:hypothetical protein n=1 Tax=Mesotoga sp. H07.pep.5.3 TaxID=1421003 RepID=UPI000C18080E|nr:hypothetical protein [Mesotoga sp. H07.pep.5.3]PIJ62813.1 hypothetical protein V513_03385 [Mesotoga sp. H07.pep.5.3]